MKQTYCSLNKTSKPDTRRSWVMSCPFCGSGAFLKEAMEGEISNCLMVWTLVVVSLCYGHTAAKFVPPGNGRLLSLLPVVFLFLLLPIRLSTISLGGLTSFFVAWLCNFKLLLFAFGKGPLTSSPPLPLSRFVATACLPIKVIKSDKAEDCEAASRKSENGLGNPANYAIKCLVSACLWTILLRVVEVPPAFFNALLCVQVYVSLELSLAMTSGIARVVTGTVLEPQFNEPYLSTSLQDFWGRRWNLMVADVMHPAVYVPVRSMSGRMIGRKWAALPAAFCTFVVSALMHELIFYYIGRKKPTWAVTSFFLLHGVCVAIEIGLKKAVANKFQLPRVVSTAFTVGFVLATGSSLFMPALLYCGMEEMGRREMLAVADFIGNLQSKTSHALITAAASGMQSTSKL